MVRMSSVSVPDPGEKIRLGAKIITAPTATRAAATSAKIGVDAWVFSCTTARPYSPCVFLRLTLPARVCKTDFRNLLDYDHHQHLPRTERLRICLVGLAYSSDQHLLYGAAGNRN